MGRFYNAGTAINEKLQYTHPIKDPKEVNTLSYYDLKAAEKDFFEVPNTLTLMTDEGEFDVPVNFTKRVKTLYQARGVVLIDARREDISDDDNAAQTDEEAKKKGDRMWKDYLRSIVREHYAAVQETKSFGGVPQPARGLTKYALTKLRMDDPADQVETIARAQEGQVSNAEMLAVIQKLRDEVNVLRGAQGALAGGVTSQG